MVSQAAILGRVMRADDGDLPPDLSRYILTLGSPPDDHARYAQLAAKAQEGTLTPDEQTELDMCLEVNDSLTIIETKARRSIRAAVKKSFQKQKPTGGWPK